MRTDVPSKKRGLRGCFSTRRERAVEVHARSSRAILGYDPRVTDAANVDLRVWPSPFNTPVAARTVFVADCTLRDGEQQAGLVFSSDAKVEIARALDDLGVFEIEAGTPAISEDDATAVARICGLALSAKISVLCRAKESDIDAAAELGVWGVRISYPVSRIQRAAKFGDATDDDYLATALRVSEHAKRQGLAVIFSPFDTTRADMPFLLSICDALASAGTVDRLRVVDTTGCASPDGISYLVSRLRTAVPSLPLEIHCHDDFGLAVANTLAGVHAGADFVSTTMNGPGRARRKRCHGGSRRCLGALKRTSHRS